jgi:hypothetical protein
MEYGAIGIVALGLISGLVLRLHAFLLVVALLLVASIAFAAFSKMTFGHAALVVLGVQIVVQLSYFVGVAIGVVLGKMNRGSHVL